MSIRSSRRLFPAKLTTNAASSTLRLALLASVAAAGASTSAVAQNLLQNSGFESPSILLPNQTDVGAGEVKILFQSTNVVGYQSHINAIPNWQNSYTDVGFGAGFRDAGIRRVDFGGSGDSRYAFINNWETRLSQSVVETVQPGQAYQASILVGMEGNFKGGRLQLWAGMPSTANPDIFPASAVLLGEVTVASTGWTGFTPDILVPLNSWTIATINYTAPTSGSMIGLPLTVSVMTNLGSAGPIFWDNATLIPSPSASAILVASMIAAARRRR